MVMDLSGGSLVPELSAGECGGGEEGREEGVVVE